MKLVSTLAVLAATTCFVAGAHAEEKPQTKFVCKFADTPIKIDGEGNEPVWQVAETIDHFYQPWQPDQPKARTATKARVLWDRDNFYFLAEMDDADLYADVKEHDGPTWENDVFELFFKPADDKPGYYEFQVNAAGTVMDMFLPRRNAGGYRRFASDGDFHLETKVALKGTLNKWHDKDEGWTVEGRIPWRDFLRSGGRPEVDEKWKFTLCRYDYSVDFEGAELSTCAPLTQANFHRFEDYATLEFAGPEQPRRDAKAHDGGATQVAARLLALKKTIHDVPVQVAGSPEPPLPYRAQRVLNDLKPSFPIFVEAEPGTNRVLLIDQKWSYGPARICCTTEKPGELATLWEFPEGGVGYSLALHPKYRENGYLYVGWNGLVPAKQNVKENAAKKEKRSIVSRFTIDRKSPHALLKDSQVTIIDWASDGHNGAAIAFGKDGLLYVTSGDGTSDSDTNVTGQGLDHLLAKLLRIDVDHPDEGRNYSVPKDNPFLGQKNVRPETWAYGFRNPWRITVDAKSGDVWVGQNGQDLWEQAMLVQRGANYGWSVYEGSHLFYPERKLGPTPVSKPTVEHAHAEARSLTGGVVYHGEKLPELRGAYIYGDYSTGKIWGAKVVAGDLAWHKELADTTLALTSFALDHAGELLITDHRGGGEGGLYTLEPSVVDASSPKFPRLLSETGLFTAVAGHQVHAGLIPYDVNAPLWSDGAYKERYLYLPSSPASEQERKLMAFDLSSDDRGWNLPEGTIAVKSFALETPQGRRWVETRLMVKSQGEWAGYSYQWNAEQSEATLVEAAGRDQAFTVASDGGEKRQTWHFPSRTECMVCHSRAANYVLGLCTLQFNKTREYNGQAIDQLDLLEWLGALKVNWAAEQPAQATRDQREAKTSSLLAKPAEQYPKLVDPYNARADLTARAKSYLHSNCAQCHIEAGGGNSQMQLNWSASLEKMKLLDVAPVHHKFDLPDAKLLAPGAPDRSILLHRMSIRTRGQMPQLATSLVDDAAVELMREWILSLNERPK